MERERVKEERERAALENLRLIHVNQGTFTIQYYYRYLNNSKEFSNKL